MVCTSKELTPSLVRIHKEYGEKVQFVSLAYEKNTQPVLDYVSKNEMVWFNGILRGTPKSNNKEELGMISKLRIDAFPTFILLDKDLNIIYRGVGNKLEELEDVIKSYHFEE